MIELGLQRISKLLAQTPLPWRAIHIAGTNGKGSVCAYISEMLNTYNRSQWRATKGQSIINHGRFTSPHTIDRWDCITLSQNDEMQVVKPELFLEVEEAVAKRNQEMNIQASEFELLTATAFEIFTRSKLDIAVIETGMGGRLDATNIIGQSLLHEEEMQKDDSPATSRPPPLVTAITKVGLDHQSFLGDTVEAIAREKAGIFKPGVPAFWDESNHQSVIEVLRTEAERRGGKLGDWRDPIPGFNVRQRLEEVWSGTNNGPHVVDNSNVAFRAAWTALSAMGRISSVTERNDNDEPFLALVRDLITAPQRAYFPGRLEWVDISSFVDEKTDPVLLDGAHNAQSAEVLGEAVANLRNAQCPSTFWIIGASDTKDMKEILRPLLLKDDHVFAVEFGPVDGMPWVAPMEASKILAAAQDVIPELRNLNNFNTDIVGALNAAHNLGKDLSRDGLPANLVIAGSLYLVGDVHRLLRHAARGKI